MNNAHSNNDATFVTVTNSNGTDSTKRFENDETAWRYFNAAKRSGLRVKISGPTAYEEA